MAEHPQKVQGKKFMFLRLNKLGFFLSILMLLGLTGCAFKAIIYEHLDWVVMHQVDSYLDLSKEQELKLKPVVSDAIHWLKKEKIPSAILVFQKLEEAARAHRYDQSLNKLLSDEVDQVRKDLITKYEQPIQQLLLSLSSDQVDYLAKKLKKSNKDMKDVLEEKNVDKAYDSIIKKQAKNVIEWYGDLENSQEEFFYKSMRLSRPQIEQRLAERERIQNYMIDTLKSKDEAKVRTMVRSMRDQGEVWQDPVYIKYRNIAEERWVVYLKALHSSLTDKQWKHLEEQLAEMRHDLERMIGRE